jgi:hypothetical protein
VAGELAAWRRRASLDDEIPAETAEPYVLQLAGDWARAAEHWRDLGCPYEAALAPTDADEEELLRRALDELERLGARPAADIVVRRLRELGVRRLPRGPRRPTPPGSRPASSRCWHCSPPTCATPTSRPACASPRRPLTTHVSAILAKLGVRSRHEAARVAAERKIHHADGAPVSGR